MYIMLLHLNAPCGQAISPLGNDGIRIGQALFGSWWAPLKSISSSTNEYERKAVGNMFPRVQNPMYHTESH